MNREIENQFTIQASSDLDYEKMVVNLNFDVNTVAILSCDKQTNQIEILDRYEDKVIWTLDCEAFIATLNRALEKLKFINQPLNEE